MTNKEAINFIESKLCTNLSWCDNADCDLCAVQKSIDALEKMDNYNKMAMHLAESGIVCEQMPLEKHYWCEMHCGEKEKPDIECVEMWLKWSDE